MELYSDDPFVHSFRIFGTDKGYRKLKALKSYGSEDDHKQMQR